MTPAISRLVIVLVAGALVAGATPGRATGQSAPQSVANLPGGEWQVVWDEQTGLPRMLWGGLAGPFAGRAAEAARIFLDTQPALFGLDADTASLRLLRTKPLPEGAHWAEFQLQYRGLDVYHCTIVVASDRAGRINSVTSTAWPVRDLDIRPALSEDAVRRRLTAIAEAQPVDILDPPELVVYPEGPGRLAYLAYLTGGPQSTPFEYLLDANTGEVIRASMLVEADDKPGPPRTIAAAERIDLGPIAPPEGRGDARELPVDPCIRQWRIHGPADETTVVQNGVPPDPYQVQVRVGILSFGSAENAQQIPAVYAAGIKLLPCKEYTIVFSYDLSTWDSYNSVDGSWDGFFVQANSDYYLWSLLSRLPFGDVSCATSLTEGGVYPPGTTWVFGGDEWGDGLLCHQTGTAQFTYREADSAKNPYLSVGLDTGWTGQVDDSYPSWGLFNLEILGQTHVFDPNPHRSDPPPPPFPHDHGNLDADVPCGAYYPVTLTDFAGQPEGDGFWHLTGQHVDIQENIEPPLLERPRSRSSVFSFTRSCPEFEAVMAYYHLTRTMQYVEGFGFTLDNKPLKVDPHGLVQGSPDNSHYVGYPLGLGYITYGIGGVDDAEDGDVILHEYGHALQDDQRPGLYTTGRGILDPSFGNETKAMKEGFCDYWACSTFEAVTANRWAMGEWDANNPNGLRQVNSTAAGAHYPEWLQAAPNNFYRSSAVWSGTLWELLNNPAVGKTVTDRLVVRSHMSVPNDPTFRDGAVALLSADATLYGSAHREQIIAVFQNRGIFRQLSVTSNTPGAAITATTDLRGNGSGTTPFERVYRFRESVALSAATTVAGGWSFVRWVVNGFDQPAGQSGVTIAMDQPHTAQAVYAYTPPVTGACCLPGGVCEIRFPADCQEAGGWWLGGGMTCGPSTCSGACCLGYGYCAETDAFNCSMQGGAWMGSGTTCSQSTCPWGLGACCLPDGTCEQSFPDMCPGTWQGFGTTCTPNPCPQPGACCSAGGGCVELLEAECYGGTWQGAGTTCTPNPCPQPGACCFWDGSCQSKLEAACTTDGGNWLGAGTTCSPNPCPQRRACCYADGACNMLIPADCAADGGTSLGAGTTCGPSPCDQPTGACCFADGSCLVRTHGQCITAGGTWQGAGSSCAPNPCPQPAACCFANGTCELLTQAACTAAGGTWQGVGSSCAPTNPCPPAPTGACCFARESYCVARTLVGCVSAGGQYQGDGTVCTPNPCLRRGDLNCDGIVNFADINPFVLALSGQAAYEAAYPNCNWLNADCNNDGTVNFADINPFVALLSQ